MEAAKAAAQGVHEPLAKMTLLAARADPNTNNTVIHPLSSHHIFTSTKKTYLELCRPSGQYPAIYLVFPCSRRNHPHFPFPSILTGFLSFLNAEAERLL